MIKNIHINNESLLFILFKIIVVNYMILFK